MDNANEYQPQPLCDSYLKAKLWFWGISMTVVFFAAAYFTHSVIWSVVVLAMYVSGLIGGSIGAIRGSPFIGFFMSFFVPVIGWIIACFLPKDESETKA